MVRGGGTRATVIRIAPWMLVALACAGCGRVGQVAGKVSYRDKPLPDGTVMLLADVVLTLPQIVLLTVLATFIRLNSPWLLAVIIALLSWPTLLRAVRAQVLSLKEREYVEAARVLDLGTPRILFVEILPNMASFILMNFTIGMTTAIYSQVFLYLFGVVPLAGNNWGIMLNLAWVRGAIFFKQSLMYILAPVVAISLLQLSIVTMTRSLEDIFNPRLRSV